jgi:hypothetical protein
LTSLPGQLVRQAAELPTLAISTAVRAAALVGEGAAAVRRDGPVSAAQSAAQLVVDETRSLVGRVAPGLVTAPRPRPTRAAPAPPPAPSPAARAAGAPGVATPVAEAAARDVRRSASSPNGSALQPADLPLDDFDHMTLGSLRGRLRTLTVDDLVVLRAYEAEHARRLQVMTMLENRIARLRNQGEQSGTAEGGTATEPA